MSFDWNDRDAVAALLPDFAEYVTYQAGFGFGFEIPVSDEGVIVVQAGVDDGDELWAGFYPFASDEATTYGRGPVSAVVDVFGDVWAAVTDPVNGQE